MKIKYKLRDKETGEVFVNVRGYLLHENGDVESILLTDNTQIPARNVTFCRFLDEVDGHDVYDGDKATVELTESIYDRDSRGYLEGEVYTINGTFKELNEEGCYYIVDDATDEAITYELLKPKILSLS